MKLTIHLAVLVGVLTLSMPSKLQADEYSFGRVFMTAAERARIDAKAKYKGADFIDTNTNVDNASEISDATDSQVVTFNGVLIHEDGKAVAWIKKPSENLQEKNLKLGKTGQKTDKVQSLAVTVSDGGKYKRVKPGQKWVVKEDTVKEAYQQTSLDLQSNPNPNTGELVQDDDKGLQQ